MGPRRPLLLEPTLEPSPPLIPPLIPVLIPALIPVLIPALIPVLMPSVIGTAAGREYSLPYTPQLAQCNDPSTEFYDEELNKCCSQCPPAKTTKHYDCKRPAKETPCPSELEFSYKVDWAGAYQEVVSELVSKGLTQAHHSGTCLTLAVKHLHMFTTKPCFCKGQYRTGSCSHTVDTKCSPCRPKTYTAIWNHSPQCFACSPPCRKGLVQNQTCTRSQDRICSCPPHKYCISKLDEYCEMCRTHKKCGKGYRVSRRGTDSTDTECEPCPPGTFSPEESYSTSCTPHTICKSVAVPGNSRNDTVCSGSGTATVLPHTILNLLVTQSPASHKAEIITQPVMLNSVPDLSHITGAVAGPLFLILIIGILGYCLVSKKKALVYSAAATEADLPFSCPEKQCDKKVRDTELQNSRNSEQEQQHLLETSGSSSSILNPTGSATISVISKENYENKNSGGFQQQHSPPEGSQFLSGDRHSSMSSEHSGNAGTQVNVTCIVKLCRPDCSSQCPEQRSSTSRDCGHTPWGSPAGEETFLSKEENALNNETKIHIAVENEDNLLQDLLPEEKKVPLGIQDAGMKTS